MAENMNSVSRVASAVEGVGGGDLVRVRRALFISALEVARGDHDPGGEWDAFAEVAWREAALAFGFAERDALPQPVDGAAESDAGAGAAS